MPSLALALSFGMLAVFMLPGFMSDYRSPRHPASAVDDAGAPREAARRAAAVQAAVAVASLPLVLALGAALGMDVPQNPLALALALVVGGAALFSLGSLVAALAPDPRLGWVGSAVIFFPSLFLAGVWLPKEQMPHWLARLGDFTPLGGFRTSVQDAWTGHALDPLILLVLAATAVAVGALAARVFRWE